MILQACHISKFILYTNTQRTVKDRLPATPGQKVTNTSVDPSSVRSKRTMNETVTF
jgi:hypothetical protein